MGNRITNLRKIYEDVVNKYLATFLRQNKLSSAYCWWVNDEPGSVLCYDDMFCIGFDDLKFCVDNEISSDEYIKYSEYIAQVHEFKISNEINFKSWVRGAPRIQQETFNRLKKLQKDLDDAVSEAASEQSTADSMPQVGMFV